MTSVRYLQHQSPIGPLLIAASDAGLCAVYMRDQRHVPDVPDTGWLPLALDDDAQARLLTRVR